MSEDSSEWNQKKKQKLTCGCGKYYKSITALSLHIKNKHAGKAPSGMAKVQPIRGRPKLVPQLEIKERNEGLQMAVKGNPMPEIVVLLTEIPDDDQDLLLVCTREPVYALIMDYQSFEEEKLIFYPQDGIYDLKMGPGLCLFFRELKKNTLKISHYHQVVLLLTLFVEHIIDQTEDRTVLSNGNIGMIPEFVNSFIIHDSKPHIDRLRISQCWICQQPNMLRFLLLFFRWLIFKKYTLTNVNLNQKFIQEHEQFPKKLFEHTIQQQQNQQQKQTHKLLFQKFRPSSDLQQSQNSYLSQHSQYSQPIQQRVQKTKQTLKQVQLQQFNQSLKCQSSQHKNVQNSEHKIKNQVKAKQAYAENQNANQSNN